MYIYIAGRKQWIIPYMMCIHYLKFMVNNYVSWSQIANPSVVMDRQPILQSLRNELKLEKKEGKMRRKV